ncbi:hypothetical protein NC653_031402 [Populus alba x Populus x berolinensis]|uniref:Uncharacterized protein n=1 Tax=Populus alba x Populus x berolinensis TaxID=444605 RepID=A0AAD6Q3D6_9ROSI|nr:hypothetical protein NC653_031402 [Populus alba x Populus x berolinensis]
MINRDLKRVIPSQLKKQDKVSAEGPSFPKWRYYVPTALTAWIVQMVPSMPMVSSGFWTPTSCNGSDRHAEVDPDIVPIAAVPLKDMYRSMGDGSCPAIMVALLLITLCSLRRQGKWEATTQSREFIKSI